MKDEFFENGDFERTLKEHADRFFLIPSERVWRSIYNDLHPGSKWPSLAVGLFMFLTLFWVGNTNREYPNKRTALPGKNIQMGTENKGDASFVVPIEKNVMDIRSSRLSEGPQSSQNKEVSQLQRTSHSEAGNNFRSKVVSLTNHLGNRAEQAGTPMTNTEKITLVELKSGFTGDGNTISPNSEENSSSQQTIEADGSRGEDVNNTVGYTDNGPVKSAIRFKSGLRKKLKWEYFFTPMISSVQFDGTNLNKSNSSVVYTPVSKHDMSIAKKIGFVVGFNTYYPLSKRFSLITGAHVVYTGYNIFSEVMQPNTTSLTFVDREGRMFSKNYISYYGNDKNKSDANIINYNWQLALPVGLEWDALPLKKVTISVVSTLEPFLVLGSNAYLLSGDASRYVTDPDLIRKFNMSGNFGGRISFSGNAVNWKIGPEFRYQILSTYNNIYPIKEHFMSYGVHVGVSKK